MVLALIGGALIGTAVSLMLIFNGRVAGISGIVAGVLFPQGRELSWKILFLFGLFGGGMFLRIFNPEAFNSQSLHMSMWDYAVAGILVGFGTVMGNGCTSGHGICGISRLSQRSILATLTFIIFGAVSVMVFKILKGEI